MLCARFEPVRSLLPFLAALSQEAAESAKTDLMTFGIEERDDMDSQVRREVGYLKAV